MAKSRTVAVKNESKSNGHAPAESVPAEHPTPVEAQDVLLKAINESDMSLAEKMAAVKKATTAYIRSMRTDVKAETKKTVSEANTKLAAEALRNFVVAYEAANPGRAVLKVSLRTQKAESGQFVSKSIIKSRKMTVDEIAAQKVAAETVETPA